MDSLQYITVTIDKYAASELVFFFSKEMRKISLHMHDSMKTCIASRAQFKHTQHCIEISTRITLSIESMNIDLFHSFNSETGSYIVMHFDEQLFVFHET